MTWKLFDYSNNGVNEIRAWSLRLEIKQLAKLNAKLDMLEVSGPNLPPNLLSDTNSRHIKKLRIKGNVQLRPMLCKGPLANDTEYTLLIGAIEKGMKLIPANAIIEAEQRRSLILDNPSRRVEHERISRKT